MLYQPMLLLKHHKKWQQNRWQSHEEISGNHILKDNETTTNTTQQMDTRTDTIVKGINKKYMYYNIIIIKETIDYIQIPSLSIHVYILMFKQSIL